MGRDDRATTRRDGRLAFDGMKKAMADRDAGSFICLPHAVIDSPGWRRASPLAKALLIDLVEAMYRSASGQLRGRPNGGLMVERDRLKARGWSSIDSISRHVKELLNCGLLVECRKGALGRPALYAVTWHGLGVDASYQLDIDRVKWNSLYRGAYLRPEQDSPEEQARKHRRAASVAKATAARKANAAARRSDATRPCDGQAADLKRPCGGQSAPEERPHDGLIAVHGVPGKAPSDGHSLEQCHLPAGQHAHEKQRAPNFEGLSGSLMDSAQRLAAMRRCGVDPLLANLASSSAPVSTQEAA